MVPKLGHKLESKFVDLFRVILLDQCIKLNVPKVVVQMNKNHIFVLESEIMSDK